MKASVSKKTLRMAQFALLLAIEAIVCFTPLGSLPAFGPIVMTLGMVPVIITTVLLGTAEGALMGFFAGLFSFLVWTFTPPSPLTAFVFTPFYSLGPVHGNFWSLVICFVPRILVGVTAGLCFSLLNRTRAPKPVVYGLSGITGSLANTLPVMGGIYIFFGPRYAEAMGLGYNALLGVIGLTLLTSGIPEAILGGAVAWLVCHPIRKHLGHNFE